MIENIDLGFYIGIFYQDENWAKQLYDEIIEDLKTNNLFDSRLSRFSKYDKYITINPYCHIKFVPADTRARGNRFNRVYYQKSIDKEVIDIRIYPSYTPWRNKPMGI